MEVNTIRHAERNRKTSAKHKWYLTEKHGMIRNLFVPDFIIYELLSIIGLLAFITLVHNLLVNSKQYEPHLIQRNVTHLFMRGDTPFTRGPLADSIDLDEKDRGVKDILKGSFEMDSVGTRRLPQRR